MRKLSEEKPVRFNVITPASLYSYACKLGPGASAGGRAALEYHRANHNAMEKFLAAFDAWNLEEGKVSFVNVLACRAALSREPK